MNANKTDASCTFMRPTDLLRIVTNYDRYAAPPRRVGVAGGVSERTARELVSLDDDPYFARAE